VHRSGFLAAQKYQTSEKLEYYAIRNSTALIDTSPLYKYRITGPDAERFLAGVLARDIRTCPIDEVRKITVRETWLGGKKVYEAAGE